MSVPSAVQIISALEVIMGRDGTVRGAQKLQQLRDNANYMRTRLTEMGCSVLGNYDSPVLVSKSFLKVFLSNAEMLHKRPASKTVRSSLSVSQIHNLTEVQAYKSQHLVLI